MDSCDLKSENGFCVSLLSRLIEHQIIPDDREHLRHEKPKRLGVLVFADRRRFCRLMKTRNRRYPRSVWDERGHF